jgi:hypothetical protein
MLTGRSKLRQYGDIPELRDSAKRTEGTVVYLWLLLYSFDVVGFDMLNPVGHFPLYAVLYELCAHLLYSV